VLLFDVIAIIIYGLLKTPFLFLKAIKNQFLFFYVIA